MKKLSYIILGLVIGAVSTYYFCPRNMEEDDNISYKKPPGVIDIAQADSLNNNWSKYRCKAVDSCIRVQTGGKKDKDSRSVWWSLKEVKQYLRYAKKESKNKGYEMTGIRVYLGVYGKEDGKEADCTTMFIVPTGHEKTPSKASMSLFSTNSMLVKKNTDIPVPPLNEGSGGTGGY